MYANGTATRPACSEFTADRGSSRRRARFAESGRQVLERHGDAEEHEERDALEVADQREGSQRASSTQAGSLAKRSASPPDVDVSGATPSARRGAVYVPCGQTLTSARGIIRPDSHLSLQGPPCKPAFKVQLSIFMFLQYFIWGSWYVSMGSYLGKELQIDGARNRLAYGAFAIGAMISPFFVGLIADRYFASEKLLGVLGLLGGGGHVLLPQMRTSTRFTRCSSSTAPTYVPTLALGNSSSLHQLENAKTTFPRVKMLSRGRLDRGRSCGQRASARKLAPAVLSGRRLSIVFGPFAFTLPHTPPKKSAQRLGRRDPRTRRAGPAEENVIRHLHWCMFLICIPLYFYFVNLHIYLGELNWVECGREDDARPGLGRGVPVLSAVHAPRPRLQGDHFRRHPGLGRALLLPGESATSAAELQTPLIFAAIILHGVCYDFLFIAGQLYVDDESNERMRGAAQGFIAFILWGIGGFVGTMIVGRVQQFSRADERERCSRLARLAEHLAHTGNRRSGGVSGVPHLLLRSPPRTASSGVPVTSDNS